MPSVWSERVWALIIGAGALVLGTAILNLPKVLPQTAGLVAPVAAALATVPLWLALPGAFLSALGVIYLFKISRALASSRATGFDTGEDAEREPEPLELEPVNPRRVEIDLQSTMPIVFVKSMSRQLFANVKVINHTPYALTITEITVKVWFGQVIIELSTRLPRDLPPHSTGAGISVIKTLEPSDGTVIQDFLDREEPTKLISVDVTLVFNADGKPFDRFEHFERRLPEANAITLGG